MDEQRPEFLAQQLRRIARDLEALEAVELARGRSRLRPSQAPVLAALLEASPLSVSELCARCEVEPSTMTGILRTLVKGGLVSREKKVLDQRSSLLSLTPRGRAAARTSLDKRAASQRALLRLLPRERVSELVALLETLGTAAQRLAAERTAEREARDARRRNA